MSISTYLTKMKPYLNRLIVLLKKYTIALLMRIRSSTASDDDTIHKELEELISLLDSSLFKGFNNSNNSIYTINAFMPTLIETNNFMMRLFLMLKKDYRVSNHVANANIRPVQVGSFFLDTERRFIDEAAEITKFKELTLQYVEFIKNNEGKESNKEFIRYNLGAVQGFTAALHQTITSLIIVSIKR